MNLFLIMNILDVEKINDGGLEKKLCFNKHTKSGFNGEIVLEVANCQVVLTY